LIARFEIQMLAECGFALDLESRAATRVREQLIYVSPKSGRADSAAAGAEWRGRLLPLPAFLRGGEALAPATGVAPASLEAGMARPIIIDTDPSPDDAVAFLMALASPGELDLLAITMVGGNAPLALTTKNPLKVLELVGRGDTPVYAGAAEPLCRVLETIE
jgi:hypothetical protein